MTSADLQRLSTAPVGFWSRGLAVVVDYILEIVAIAILLAMVGADPKMADGTVAVDSLLTGSIVYVLPFVATLLFWSHKQATPGKMVIRARIVDARTGEAAGAGQLVVRYLGYLVSLLPLGLGFVWAAFDPRKQAWHDKLARTVVVRTRAAQAASAPHPAPALRAAISAAPAVAWPRCAAGAGPWINSGAKPGQPSLLWLTRDTLHLAAPGSADLPGFAAAAAAGHPVPSQAVPLWCLHSVEGPDDSAEVAVTYTVQGGGAESTTARLKDVAQREQLFSALQHHLGAGWVRTEERENRWTLAGNLIAVMLVIAGGTLFLQWTAGLSEMPQVEGTDRAKLVLTLAMLAAQWAGSAMVGTVGKVLVALTALLIPVALFSPPRRYALRRAVPATPQPMGAPYAYQLE